MVVRRDHVAGLGIAAAMGGVWLMSGDLPVGSLSMPGAGMMPKLIVIIGAVLALAVAAGGGKSPPVAEVDWSDLPHALAVMAVTIPAAAIYTGAGFVVSMTLLLLTLLVAVEKRGLVGALAFSIGVALCTYLLFGTVLKSPLPQGVMPF